MLIAKTESGGRIYARDAEKGQNYYCQLCNKKLILRKGYIKMEVHMKHVLNAIEKSNFLWEEKDEAILQVSNR